MVDFDNFDNTSAPPRPYPGVKPEDVVYFESGDAAALYVDGELVDAHHPPEIREKLFDVLGIREVGDDAFMLGQSSWSGVAPTLEDAELFAITRKTNYQRAIELREQAAKLQAEADLLDGG